MNEATSNLAESNSGKSKELWLGTFYFGVPLNILNDSPYFSCIRKYRKPTFIDISLEFQFRRISGLHFKITCIRRLNSIPDGDYKFQFYCDIFDEDSKMFEMQSVETVAEVDFSLKQSQYLTLRDFGREYDVKILVKMIEYDMVVTENHILQRDLFREENKQVFNNKSVLMDLCYILHVPRLEDIFTGRQNREFIVKRSCFIQRAAKYCCDIATYLKRKRESTRLPIRYFERILKYILNKKTGGCFDSDLLNLYNMAHYLGLDFLIELSQDFLLHRLEEYKMKSFRYYEACMFDVIDAAVGVNDEKFFDIVVADLHMAKPFFNSRPLWNRLEELGRSSNFAIHFAQERLKKLDAQAAEAEAKKRRGGSGGASSSNVYL